jgi:hypothetical protein
MIESIWLTENQIKIQDGFRQALTDKRIVSIIDFPGTGFKHAFRRFCNLNSDVRSVFVEIPIGRNATRSIVIKMMTQLMTIMFNNFKYTQPTAFDLLRVLGERVRQDLRGKKILIVFDGVDNLSNMKLAHFMDLIKHINFPCAIVLRFGADYFAKLKSHEKIYNEFWILTQWRKVTKQNTEVDIEKFCRLHGITNPIFLREIRERTKSFTIAKEFVKSYKGYLPPSQLNLFSENLVRI